MDEMDDNTDDTDEMDNTRINEITHFKFQIIIVYHITAYERMTSRSLRLRERDVILSVSARACQTFQLTAAEFTEASGVKQGGGNKENDEVETPIFNGVSHISHCEVE